MDNNKMHDNWQYGKREFSSVRAVLSHARS